MAPGGGAVHCMLPPGNHDGVRPPQMLLGNRNQLEFPPGIAF